MYPSRRHSTVKLFNLSSSIFNKKDKIEFFIDKSNCPYIKEIVQLKDWRDYAMNQTKEEIKNWTVEEKNFFSELTKITKKTNSKIKS